MSRAQEALIKEEIQKFTQLPIFDLYKELFRDKDYIYSLLEDPSFHGCLDEIIKFTQENLDSNLLHYDDAAVLAYLYLKIYGTNEYKSIKQVVIDEAQDYYPLQYEIFNLLFPTSKFTILGDMNQTLEKQEDLSLYEQISSILNKKKSSLVTMDKSFRCTNEILNYSLKFIEHNPGIKSFNRQGDEPEIYAASSQTALSELILAEVNTCQEKGYRSIGLICKSEKNALSLFECLKGKIDIQLIKNESMADLHGVFIIPVYMSKGLEFDAVLICDTTADHYNSEDDKNLLYIACTRALHRLNLFCTGEPSPLL